MFGFPKWIIAGSIGGAIGAAAWGTISYFANAEVGYVAWGIGFIVGFFVRVAAGESETGLAPGLTAAIVAIAAVLGGKYAAVHMLISKELAAGEMVNITPNEMIVERADEIVKQREAKGQKVVFPGGKTVDEATEQADYPPDVWNEAAAQWNKLPPDEQQKKLEATKQHQLEMLKALGGAVRQQAFLGSFSLFDLLWFFLAAGTAYKLGAGGDDSEEATPAAST